MTFALVPSQSDILTAYRAFLLSVLPSGIEIVQGQSNRVPEPVGPDYVIFTPMGRVRLSTNVDTYADCAFFGAVSGQVLTVTPKMFGVVVIGSTLFGVGVADGTTILAQTSGYPGGQGQYTLSQAMASPNPSSLFACGLESVLQPTRFTIQTDVYGPASGDNAQTITSFFRDDYAALWFTRNGFSALAPLYAEDPRQLAFNNGEQQFEDRWSVDVVLQANQVASLPMQFAGAIEVDTIPVDAGFFQD